MLKKIALYQVHLPTNEISAVYAVDTLSVTPEHAAAGQIPGIVGAGMGVGLGVGPIHTRPTTARRTVSLRQTYQYVDCGPHIKERRKVDFTSTDWQIETPLLAAP